MVHSKQLIAKANHMDIVTLVVFAFFCDALTPWREHLLTLLKDLSKPALSHGFCSRAVADLDLVRALLPQKPRPAPAAFGDRLLPLLPDSLRAENFALGVLLTHEDRLTPKEFDRCLDVCCERRDRVPTTEARTLLIACLSRSYEVERLTKLLTWASQEDYKSFVPFILEKDISVFFLANMASEHRAAIFQELLDFWGGTRKDCSHHSGRSQEDSIPFALGHLSGRCCHLCLQKCQRDTFSCCRWGAVWDWWCSGRTDLIFSLLCRDQPTNQHRRDHTCGMAQGTHGFERERTLPFKHSSAGEWNNARIQLSRINFQKFGAPFGVLCRKKIASELWAWLPGGASWLGWIEMRTSFCHQSSEIFTSSCLEWFISRHHLLTRAACPSWHHICNAVVAAKSERRSRRAKKNCWPIKSEVWGGWSCCSAGHERGRRGKQTSQPGGNEQRSKLNQRPAVPAGQPAMLNTQPAMLSTQPAMLNALLRSIDPKLYGFAEIVVGIAQSGPFSEKSSKENKFLCWYQSQTHWWKLKLVQYLMLCCIMTYHLYMCTCIQWDLCLPRKKCISKNSDAKLCWSAAILEPLSQSVLLCCRPCRGRSSSRFDSD